ncbi:MAG: polyamine ABC transporter permease [Myxococcales bacterium]
MSGSRAPAGSTQWALTAPTVAWLAIFFVAPTLIVVAFSFRPADPYGGFGDGLSLDTFGALWSPMWPPILLRTVVLALATTLLCVPIGAVVAYAMARTPKRWRGALLVAVVVPFWTNFLIRILAWKVILHPSGMIAGVLTTLRLTDPDTLLLYRWEAVLAVLVYTSIPFAVLPIYAAAEKLDVSLLEAARDLGASSAQTFLRVFVPSVGRGVAAAAFMVFVPALGAYAVPELVGGASSEMIGSKIAQRALADRNLPQACAIAVLLCLLALLPLLWRLRDARTARGGAT